MSSKFKVEAAGSNVEIEDESEDEDDDEANNSCLAGGG
jgi:hypothetical protein